MAEKYTLCPICYCELRDPHQISCCGSIYCKGCAQLLETGCSNFKCPVCLSDAHHYFSDTRTGRKMKSLEVYCIIRKSYCAKSKFKFW